MKANNIILVPETHWDREWYLPFQEFRAKLVIMMDKLLNILKTDLEYKNFTLDGQVIPLEDYLEVRPEREEEVRDYVKQGRLSLGPMYVLPDEFLVSGESLIRNLMIGHQIARGFGRIMNTVYIPDPFGHIAQLPQIAYGFDHSSIIFERGFGNEFIENELNMEFYWDSPGNAASVLGIHLIRGYGSLAFLNISLQHGIYKNALEKIKRVVADLENYTATPIVLLNNGSDHYEANPKIAEIVKQWNQLYPDVLLEQNDFEYYINKILKIKPKLKSFQGELRGAKYSNLLSGVFSARMWIKQRNSKIEYIFEKYTEPISTITWLLDKFQQFDYPESYIRHGLKWLLKNHPHDSICGCSIDQVHKEMITRFDWAEQIGNEIFNLSFQYLSDLITLKNQVKSRIALIVFNPLPWKRRDIVIFKAISRMINNQNGFPKDFKIIDSYDKEIEYQGNYIPGKPRFSTENDITFQVSFIADVPACGYKVYYILLKDEPKRNKNDKIDFTLEENLIENEFYKVEVKKRGQINVYDKKSEVWFENVCQFEDVGDWGDEYDFSGPTRKQINKKYTTEDTEILEKSLFLNGPSQKTIKIKMIMKLPVSLTLDRLQREDKNINNIINLYISLYKGINRIDFKIDLENNSKDHRIRVLFPSKITTDKVFCDGHFYVVSRNILLPNGRHWSQKPSKTNHQKDFIMVNDKSKCFAVLNRGLPEYEAIKDENGSIKIAITLLRCIEWLSRHNIDSRRNDAGPSLNTPEAQCLDRYEFELSLIIDKYKSNWWDSEIHIKGKEYNCPLKPIFPRMLKSTLRSSELLLLSRNGVLSDLDELPEKNMNSFLPNELSFLNIDNKNIILSALKKAEKGNYLIIRVYNISPSLQKAKLKFYKEISIKKVEIVNFLEEKSRNKVKARIDNYINDILEISLEPHVIATFKIECDISK